MLIFSIICEAKKKKKRKETLSVTNNIHFAKEIIGDSYFPLPLPMESVGIALKVK